MSRRGWALFALMSVIWGVPYLMIKVAVEGGVSVPVLVFARTALGAVVLLPLALLRGGLRPAGLRRHRVPLTVFAALEIIVPWALLSDAEHHLTSSMTGLLIAASPIVAVVAARLSGDDERLTVKRTAGLTIGLAGVAMLAAPGLHGGTVWPICEVLLVAACYAVAPRIAARRLQSVPDLHVTAVCLTGAALIYVVPAALTWPAALPSGRVLASLTGLGVVCTALAFIVFFALIREAGPARALVFTYVNPAVAVAAGVVLLGEPLTASIVGAFALILAGSVLATSRPAVPASAAAASAATALTASGEDSVDGGGSGSGSADGDGDGSGGVSGAGARPARG